MDENYREIPGTNPKQYLTDYVAFTDRILPPIQDPIQKMRSANRVLRRMGRRADIFRPTIRTTACRRAPTRSGTMPIAATGVCSATARCSKVAANTKPFLLQTYRRDMGGGNFVLMKDLSSPIHVRGRHWGAFRMGFRQS